MKVIPRASSQPPSTSGWSGARNLAAGTLLLLVATAAREDNSHWPRDTQLACRSNDQLADHWSQPAAHRSSVLLPGRAPSVPPLASQKVDNRSNPSPRGLTRLKRQPKLTSSILRSPGAQRFAPQPPALLHNNRPEDSFASSSTYSPPSFTSTTTSQERAQTSSCWPTSSATSSSRVPRPARGK